MCCASVLVCAMCVCLCCVCLSGQNWLQADRCVVCVCNRGLAQYWHRTGTVLGQYWHSTGPVLTQYWHSTVTVLPEYSQSTHTVLNSVLPEYMHSQPSQPLDTNMPPQQNRNHKNWEQWHNTQPSTEIKTPTQSLKKALKINSLLRRILGLLWKSNVT